jgi:ESCRT-II complex subunit VPS22
MCNVIGVDPLAASNVKGKNARKGLGDGASFWTQIMGGDMNDFYFEVAVRVVELCRETRSENGGLLGVEECRKRVGKGKAIGSGLEVTEYASPPNPSDYMDVLPNGSSQLLVTMYYEP